ncbi:MAG: glutathione S-transferase [Phenylobacterium sp.]|uniref:glutathione S-transferase family protein n=1 Tax=Phenylobacterium sp. TaxID=1871053 RepID=UPI0025D3D2F7|nr:glutathione S-transferase family protein [Phenylobacterium sp.]MBA4012404.1 glutathione S-transferase [Phenylobacterium sp.]
MNQPYVVHGAAGSGSVPVEATLTLLGLPYRVVENAPWASRAAADAVGQINRQRQVPAVITPDGELLTESAAILIHLADRHPQAGLAPAIDAAERAQFLRWMIYLPAQVYSMFWVRDDPSRLAADPAAEQVISERTAQRIADCWRMMDEQVAPSDYILSDALSVLDLYVAVMSRWTPRRKVFYQVAPKLAEVVRRVDAEPRLAAFWAERMPFEGAWEG